MTPHDANTGRRASKTVGSSEREKDDSGFFYPELAGLDVNLGLELTSTLIDIRWWDQRSKRGKLSSLDSNFCNYDSD